MDKVLPELALVCVFGSLLAPAGSLTEGKGERHTFYVHVYNYAHIGDSVLAKAEEEAARLFLQAGVLPIWVACPLSESEIDRYPECHQTKGLILNISRGGAEDCQAKS